MLIFDETVRWIQISSTAVFLVLLMGKTIYLRRKERLNAIIFGSGRERSSSLFSILSVLAVNIWIAFILFYHLHEGFYSGLSPLRISGIDAIWVKIIGLILLLTAFAILIIAQLALGNSWRLGIDRIHPGRLVTGDIYSYSRHPIYLFFDLYFFSVFLLSANLVFLMFTVVIALILHLQALAEEKFLISIHGTAYRDYISRVGMYITVAPGSSLQDARQSDTTD